MSDTENIVYIVDDDEAVRDSLCFLLKSVGITGIGFSSGNEFLDAYEADLQGCILLDIRMPGVSGMEVQRQLAEQNCALPIIFITGHGDIPMAVEAMHLGRIRFHPETVS